jgi:hypothetical protein
MIARKQWQSAYGAGSSNCRSESAHKTHTSIVVRKDAAKWDFNGLHTCVFWW